MAKKKREDTGINMDVMMDSMTNVVGTLLLILIVVQLQISTAVETIETVLKNITKDDIAKLRQKIQQQSKDLTKVDPINLAAELKSVEGQVKETKERVDIYSKEGTDKGFALLSVKELIEKRKEFNIKAREDRKKFAEISAERRRLQALLDKTPEPKAAPAAEVTIPAARPVPKGAQYVDVLVTRNRVYFMSDDSYRNFAQKSYDAVKHTMVWSNRVDKESKKVTVIYDHKKSIDWLNRWATNIADPNLTARFPMRTKDNRIYLELVPKPEGGFSIEDLKKDDNEFRKQLLALRRNPKFVLWFRVNWDSVEAYIEARNIAQAVAMPAGWEFYRWGGQGFHMGPEVNRLEKYVPWVPPTTERQKSSVVQIAAPKRTID